MNVTRRKKRTAKIGIFGVGFNKYWPQFEGLLDELTGKLNIFVDRVKASEVQVTSFGIAETWYSATCLPMPQAAHLV